MSNFLYKEIESKLFEIDAHLSQESYLDDGEINFLSKILSMLTGQKNSWRQKKLQ